MSRAAQVQQRIHLKFNRMHYSDTSEPAYFIPMRNITNPYCPLANTCCSLAHSD